MSAHSVKEQAVKSVDFSKLLELTTLSGLLPKIGRVSHWSSFAHNLGKSECSLSSPSSCCIPDGRIARRFLQVSFAAVPDFCSRPRSAYIQFSTMRLRGTIACESYAAMWRSSDNFHCCCPSPRGERGKLHGAQIFPMRPPAPSSTNTASTLY
ncbi:uncharacterized protein BO72DRAFT_113271 [Aspergillus fijiensis CBS 313.89]|uniref:Uncharacterized protein n=1 Tax=Aspergillus fijiensis CBS 313.89 TaxID=1448319 RepID=A0A8G1RPK8_9EURO|nr:uncharacterized protein BO72DRAFT_113271 [Aspergillus fijiensis CBS 313.89]RAK77135.1 hypothetical protein BO72DRAFT_113271 [Aspergillus fijiensis CBS 313.89]